VAAGAAAAFRNGGVGVNAVVGLLAGGAAGTFLGALVAAAGLLHGLYQLLAGVVATPAALRAARDGMVWDPVGEEWIVYTLQDEWNELEQRKAGRSSVRNTALYDLLGVATTATSKDIKRAYYQRAREWHPDKNPGDEDAAERFRELHAAYQTLSNDDGRAAYDATGVSSPSHAGDSLPFDPYVFYAVLFGSAAVEPYIGELTVASFTDRVLQLIRLSQTGGGGSVQDVLLQFFSQATHYKPRKRQLEVALNLKQRVEPYVSGASSAEEFRESCQREAADIVGAPFGTQYLQSIGTALRQEASMYLAMHSRNPLGWMRGGAVWTKKTFRRFKMTASLVSESFDVLRLLARERSNETSAAPPGSSNKKSKEGIHFQLSEEDVIHLLPEILEAAWAYNFQDISATLHGACTRLFADASTNSRYKRLERAEAVQILGEEFLRAASSVKKGRHAPDNCDIQNDDSCPTQQQDTSFEAEHLMARLQVAFEVSHMKATGQGAPKDSETMIKKKKERSRAN
jgi:hypothetical protein